MRRSVASGAAVWLGVVVAASIGLVSLSLIDSFVLLGIVIVLPLAIGGSMDRWLLVGASATIALLVDAGWQAAVFVLPWVVFAVADAVRTGWRAGRVERWALLDAAAVLARLYAVVAAGGLLTSRLGANPFAIGEPIVELTSIHYIYAGAAALVLAEQARTTSRHGRVGLTAVGLTAAAPPVIGLGFVVEHPLPQVGGAVLMALGVCTTGALHLGVAADRDQPRLVRLLLGASGLVIWVPMALAVAWVAGQHWDVPFLSVPDMARTHGAANAIGFIICGLVGRRLQQQAAPNPAFVGWSPA